MTVYCRDCKHCTPDPINGLRFATCALFPRTVDPAYLVTGENPNANAFQFCTVVRDRPEDTSTLPNRCGPAGIRFERRLEAA